MMKRCLFACLFAGILCLVNVANADYQWSNESDFGASVVDPGTLEWKRLDFNVVTGGTIVETSGYGSDYISISPPVEHPSDDSSTPLGTYYSATINLSNFLSEILGANFYYLRVDGTNVLAFNPESSLILGAGINGKDKEITGGAGAGVWYLSNNGDGINRDASINVYNTNETYVEVDGIGFYFYGLWEGGTFTLEVAKAPFPTTGPTDPNPATPEPATLAIFGLGLAGLGLCRRLRK